MPTPRWPVNSISLHRLAPSKATRARPLQSGYLSHRPPPPSQRRNLSPSCEESFMPKKIARRALFPLVASAVALGTTARPSKAASAYEIDADVNVTLARLFRQVPGSADLANRAFGILVFPSIVKAGV